MLTNGNNNGASHLENCLVVDLGTATTKSGWSNRSEPDLSIPSIVGHGRHKGHFLSEDKWFLKISKHLGRPHGS